MSVAVDKEQVVAGFINTNKDGLEFSIEDVYFYVRSLWNAGCGPVRLNFTRYEMKRFLDNCDGVCLRTTGDGYVIDKSLLNSYMSEKERELLHNDEELAKSFDLFCRLQVNIVKTPRYLLDAMGYKFFYS